MKSLLYFIITLLGILPIQAQEPLIKFYFQDGKDKSYIIADIDNLSFIKSKLTAYMTLFRNRGSLNVTFDTKFIDKINFDSDRQTMNILNKGKQLVYYLYTVDSIVFKEIDLINFDTVTIGNQVWMLKNLDVRTYRNGDTIRYAESNEDWIDAGNKKEGAWCYYNNDPANGLKYGKLYNWYAVNDSRGLAPNGYKVPGEIDFIELKNFLKNDTLFWCDNNSSYIAKSIAFNEDWQLSNIKCAVGNDLLSNNRSGFSALPGGYRMAAGNYGSKNLYCFLWSKNQLGSNDAWQRHISNIGHAFLEYYSNKSTGFSVRCLKD